MNVNLKLIVWTAHTLQAVEVLAYVKAPRLKAESADVVGTADMSFSRTLAFVRQQGSTYSSS